MDPLDTLLSISLDLTSALTATDRYDRLLSALKRAIPYDAAALLRLEGDVLRVVTARGLAPQALGRRYPLGENPRLDIICKSKEPVRFPADTGLPDPFDRLLEGVPPDQDAPIHACMGAPLIIQGELIGALTADALSPAAFDGLDLRFLAAVAALASAEIHTIDLFEALEQAAQRKDRIARDLMRDARLRQGGGQLIGTAPPMERLAQEINLVARSDLTVLVTGESGTGKELVVRAVHDASDRREEPLLYVNCAALPETLADSELFGHRRGAFTGASEDRPGKLEVADGGTLFLDEIGELPLTIQPKLLRAIQEGEIQRVGNDRPLHVDVRILAATNRDLEAEVAAGRFRADLFHRLNVYPLHVPPLRQRQGDIPLLAGYFCDLARRRLGLGPVTPDQRCLQLLGGYAWPGNVRELENIISRATLRAAADFKRGEEVVLSPEHLGSGLAEGISPQRTDPAPEASPVDSQPLRQATEDFQREMIRRAVERTDGNWAAAARELGLHRSNLHHLAGRLGLK